MHGEFIRTANSEQYHNEIPYVNVSRSAVGSTSREMPMWLKTVQNEQLENLSLLARYLNFCGTPHCPSSL